jgi:hypothetical protein
MGGTTLLRRTGAISLWANPTFIQHRRNRHFGSQPTFAAFAHRKNWVAAPSVRFLHVAQFSLRLQRTSALRPYLQNVHAAAFAPLPFTIKVGFRPLAAFQQPLRMLHGGPSEETFVDRAAFCRAERRSANKACFCCGSAKGRFEHSMQPSNQK